jgi:hypothetical protein
MTKSSPERRKLWEKEHIGGNVQGTLAEDGTTLHQIDFRARVRWFAALAFVLATLIIGSIGLDIDPRAAWAHTQSDPKAAADSIARAQRKLPSTHSIVNRRELSSAIVSAVERAADRAVDATITSALAETERALLVATSSLIDQAEKRVALAVHGAVLRLTQGIESRVATGIVEVLGKEEGLEMTPPAGWTVSTKGGKLLEADPHRNWGEAQRRQLMEAGSGHMARTWKLHDAVGLAGEDKDAVRSSSARALSDAVLSAVRRKLTDGVESSEIPKLGTRGKFFDAEKNSLWQLAAHSESPSEAVDIETTRELRKQRRAPLNVASALLASLGVPAFEGFGFPPADTVNVGGDKPKNPTTLSERPRGSFDGVHSDDKDRSSGEISQEGKSDNQKNAQRRLENDGTGEHNDLFSEEAPLHAAMNDAVAGCVSRMNVEGEVDAVISGATLHLAERVRAQVQTAIVGEIQRRQEAELRRLEMVRRSAAGTVRLKKESSQG